MGRIKYITVESYVKQQSLLINNLSIYVHKRGHWGDGWPVIKKNEKTAKQND